MSAIDPPEKKQHGCFFYGCITLIVFGLVAAICIFLAIHYFAKWANATIVEFTETQATTFPTVDMPEAELKKLQEKLVAFDMAMDAHSNTPPLVLTARDINALLAANTNLKDLKNTIYVEIDGDTLKGKLSLPLGKYFRVPFVHFKGRYLNGVGTFKASVTNEALSVYVRSLEVKGKPLPPSFMTQLENKDMAEDFDQGATNRPVDVPHYESIEVKDGKITLKAKEYH